MTPMPVLVAQGAALCLLVAWCGGWHHLAWDAGICASVALMLITVWREGP
jgi:hypothetical protein